NFSMSVEKTVYTKGETITVNIIGATFDQKWTTRVVLAYAGSAANTGLTSQQISAAGTSTLTFNAPNEDTFYELRLYRDTSSAESAIIQRIPFSVVLTAGLTAPPTNFSMSVEKTVYTKGETITVNIIGATFDQKWTTRVVLAYAGSAANTGLTSQQISAAGTSTLTFNAPNENTNYELRLYRDTSSAESAIIQRIPFSVIQ
ncbi:MAG: hypothetical protein FWH24_03135, partial [Oscillospiraceae bacterium]|nr:hypothetical protein [Oscillospiraceae bacterium]